MPQDTSKEFGYRLNQAVEGHPLSPPTPFGRQSWLKKKLEKDTKLEVSNNTLSKWFNGVSAPRPDTLRKIATVLSVDEVWLGSGRKPFTPVTEAKTTHAKARGAVLALAGAIETTGGRVSFLDDEADLADLHINIAGSSFRAIVVKPKVDGNTLTYLVPEPVGDARILSVTVSTGGNDDCSVCMTILDITNCTRQSLGGYSVIVLTEDRKGCFSYDDGKGPGAISKVRALDELAV